MSRTLALYMLLYFIVFPGRAMAGNILFVNYNGSDNGIPTAICTSQNACFPWSMFLPAMTDMGKR